VLIAALVALLTQQIKLTVVAAAALLLAFFAVRMLVASTFKPLSWIHGHLHGAWRLGLGQWLNYRLQNATQATVFGLIFMVLFSVYSSRTQLLDTWQQQVPDGAPNHFLFNIYDHQKEAIETFIAENAENASTLYAMTRGRVIAVNNLTWEEQLAASPNKKLNDFERELNLTWTQHLQDDNTIVAGQWWPSVSDGDPLLISVEQEYAKGADIAIGDTIGLSLAGQVVTATVANIRSLNWQSMRPNFYIIFNRKPTPYVTTNGIVSFYLPPEKKLTINALIKQFPSVTLVEVDQTLAAITTLIDQLGLAVEYLLVLIILAAILVLMTGLLVTLPLRLRVSALLRAFGASSRLIQKALWCEFLMLGLVAGLVACVGTELLVRFWLAKALELNSVGFLSVWLWGMPITCLVLGAAGVMTTRDALRVPPSQLLKAAT
jgi:putative ABC transport system permease protein